MFYAIWRIIKDKKAILSMEYVILTVLSAAVALGVISIFGPSLKDLSDTVVNTISQRIVGE